MSTIEKAIQQLDKEKAAKSKPAHSGPAGDTVTRAVAEPDAGAIAEKAKPRGAKAAASTIENAAPVAKAAPAAQGKSSILELPLADLAQRGMLTPNAPRSRIAEEYRTIKRPLLRNIEGHSAASVEYPNLLMVTSALQGDGKTFTAINLALSIALEQDKTVMFVDADVAKASAGRLLGLSSDQPGLIDVLERPELSLKDVLVRTSLENFSILPAGNVHERSTELLASHAMHSLMMEMANRYSDRVIVFDSPPLLLTTEASVLASFMGQIAFVVSTDETPQEAVTEALSYLGEDKIVGTILNKAHSRRSGFLGLGARYGYGAGYGYGYGYGYGSDGRAQSAPGKG